MIKKLREKVIRKIEMKLGIKTQCEQWKEIGEGVAESFKKGIDNSQNRHTR